MSGVLRGGRGGSRRRGWGESPRLQLLVLARLRRRVAGGNGVLIPKGLRWGWGGGSGGRRGAGARGTGVAGWAPRRRRRRKGVRGGGRAAAAAKTHGDAVVCGTTALFFATAALAGAVLFGPRLCVGTHTHTGIVAVGCYHCSDVTRPWVRWVAHVWPHPARYVPTPNVGASLSPPTIHHTSSFRGGRRGAQRPPSRSSVCRRRRSRRCGTMQMQAPAKPACVCKPRPRRQSPRAAAQRRVQCAMSPPVTIYGTKTTRSDILEFACKELGVEYEFKALDWCAGVAWSVVGYANSSPDSTHAPATCRAGSDAADGLRNAQEHKGAAYLAACRLAAVSLERVAPGSRPLPRFHAGEPVRHGADYGGWRPDHRARGRHAMPSCLFRSPPPVLSFFRPAGAQTESGAAVEYLAERFGTGAFAHDTLEKRAKARRRWWMRFGVVNACAPPRCPLTRSPSPPDPHTTRHSHSSAAVPVVLLREQHARVGPGVQEQAQPGCSGGHPVEAALHPGPRLHAGRRAPVHVPGVADVLHARRGGPVGGVEAEQLAGCGRLL